MMQEFILSTGNVYSFEEIPSLSSASGVGGKRMIYNTASGTCLSREI